jgi:hypothetical protein
VVFEFILFLFSCISVNSILNPPSNGAENQ